MTTIRFSIGTQSYTLSCEEGEEAHIRQLEKSVNQRFETIQRTFGTAGNQLVMAVTMLMMEEDIQRLQQGKTANMTLSQPQTAVQASPDETLIRKQAEDEIYHEVALRLEQLAKQVEKG